MASIRSQGSTFEIRECRSTDAGPRQHTLARFKHVLTPEVLDEAAARAQRRFGWPLDPSLVHLLKEALAACEARPLPAHLSDASEWLGRSEAARGKALRGLLRAASRIVRSRGPRREQPHEPFPRFSSGEAAS